MIALDHIALWTRNHYRATHELSRQTGLGSADGGYFPLLGLAQKIVPLGGDTYIEIEGLVDYDAFTRGGWIAEAIARSTGNGDCFMGWCLRSDSLEEIELFAAHRGVEPTSGIVGGLTYLDDPVDAGALILTPAARDAWPIGKPNMYYVPQFAGHPARRAVLRGTGDAVGEGVGWVEIGGIREELAEWLGPAFDATEAALEIRYNGGRSGLHALGVVTAHGEIEIRRQPPRQ